LNDQTVPTPRAWHSNPALKAEVMERLRAHRAADSFIQGFYQLADPKHVTGYRGCALGCTLPKLSRKDFAALESRDDGRPWWERIEREYGIPAEVAGLIDYIFEEQDSFVEAADFAVAVIEAVPVGAELDRIEDAWIDAQMYDAELGAAARWLIDALSNAPVPAGV
jgi:hypothetical protein